MRPMNIAIGVGTWIHWAAWNLAFPSLEYRMWWLWSETAGCAACLLWWWMRGEDRRVDLLAILPAAAWLFFWLVPLGVELAFRCS